MRPHALELLLKDFEVICFPAMAGYSHLSDSVNIIQREAFMRQFNKGTRHAFAGKLYQLSYVKRPQQFFIKVKDDLMFAYFLQSLLLEKEAIYQCNQNSILYIYPLHSYTSCDLTPNILKYFFPYESFSSCYVKIGYFSPPIW